MQIHADANSGEARHAARLAEHLGAILKYLDDLDDSNRCGR